MEPIYVDTFTVSDLQCDRFGRLKMSAICWLVQEMTGRHCQRLGLDWETLAQRQLFWAIVRHRVHISRLPEKDQVIRLETWPMPTTRVSYPRCVVAYDSQGQELFRSTSLWILMDLQTRVMLLPGKSGVEVNGVLRGGELSSPLSLHPFTPAQCQQRSVVFTDLDRNGHMNNCRYLDWAADLLPSDFHQSHAISGFTLCYLNEAREGDRLTLGYSQNSEGVLQLEIQRDQDGQSQRIFGAELEF